MYFSFKVSLPAQIYFSQEPLVNQFEVFWGCGEKAVDNCDAFVKLIFSLLKDQNK